MSNDWKIPQSNMLDSAYSSCGYVTKNGEYAAIPYQNQFIILNKGQQVHTARTIETAINYINSAVKKNKSRKP